MTKEEGRFNPESPERPHLEVMDGGKENAETPMEERKLEHYLLTGKEEDLQLFKEYLATYQKTDALFDSMRKAKDVEKAELKKRWSSAKEALDLDFLGLSRELRNLLEDLPGFGRKETMRGLQFLATDVTARRGDQLQEVVTRQATVDKARIQIIRKEIRRERNTAQRRTHAIPHVEEEVEQPARPQAGWFKRNIRNVALALLPFIGGGAIGTSVSRKGEEVAKPSGVTDTMREEELPPMPLKSRVEIPEDEAEVIESKKPVRVVTKEKIRKAVERKTARERHEAELRSTGTPIGMTPEEEKEFATPLAVRMQRQTETFEPLDINEGATGSGGRSQDLYENLQAMDPTGAGTHVGLTEEEIQAAADAARDRVLGKYGVSPLDDDSQAEGGPQASH